MIRRGRVRWGRMGLQLGEDVDMRHQVVEEDSVGMCSRRRGCLAVVVVERGIRGMCSRRSKCFRAEEVV